MTPLLEVEALTVRFLTPAGALEVVGGVSFELQAGQALGLVGESGSGKSVTALALLGLHPPARTRVSGAVRLLGQDLLSLGEPGLRAVRGAAVGMVFQDPGAALDPSLPVGAQVEEPLALHRRLARGERRARVLALLEEVGLPRPGEVARAYPHQLSGGMRQRVMIAAALAADPKLLVADEPTTALDVTLQAQLMELLGRLLERRGMGLLLISHDLALVAERCAEVVVLYAGRTVERGPTREVLERPAHPYTAGLVASSPRLGQARARLQELPGTVPDLAALPSGCRFRTRCPHARPACAEAEPPWQPLGPGRWHRCLTPLDPGSSR